MSRLIIFVVISLTIFFPINTFAYLDPGTGSYIVQIVIAGVVSSLFAIKIFWKRLKNLITKIFGKG